MNNDILNGIISFGRPEHMTYGLAALFLVGTVYILIHQPSRPAKYTGVASGVVGATTAVMVMVGIYDLFERANTIPPRPGVMPQHLHEVPWVASFLLVVISVAFGLQCLWINPYSSTRLRRLAVWSGGTALVVGSVSLAAGCSVMLLTNNASLTKVTMLRIWQHTTLAAVTVGVIFVISATFAVVQHRRIRREDAEQSRLHPDRAATYGGLMNDKLHGTGDQA